MKLVPVALTGSLGAVALAAALSTWPVPSYSCGGQPCPPPELEKGNNGYGQEKRGIDDGTNPGSDNGAGIPAGGPGADLAGMDSKQNGSADDGGNLR